MKLLTRLRSNSDGLLERASLSEIRGHLTTRTEKFMIDIKGSDIKTTELIESAVACSSQASSAAGSASVVIMSDNNLDLSGTEICDTFFEAETGMYVQTRTTMKTGETVEEGAGEAVGVVEGGEAGGKMGAVAVRNGVISGNNPDNMVARQVVDDGGFARRLTKDELFALKQVRKVERDNHARNHISANNRGHNSSEMSVLFWKSDTEDSSSDGGFLMETFVAIYQDVKRRMPSATPRITKNKKLEIKVSAAQELAIVRSWTTIGGIGVKPYENSPPQLWGRITGVHHQLPEAAIEECLRSQGVCKVRRVQYTVFLESGEGRKVEKRNTDKMDIQFDTSLRGTVNILGCNHEVTLKAPLPTQCTKCLKYNHRKDECQESAICARCGETGHMAIICRKVMRCVNCHLPHNALSTSCMVNKAWSNIANNKYVQRVMESTNAIVETSLTNDNGPAEPVATSEIPSGLSGGQANRSQELKSKNSYWQAVRNLTFNMSDGSATHVKLQADKPAVPRHMLPQAAMTPSATRQERHLRSTVQHSHDKIEEMKLKMKKVWEMMTEFLKTYGDKFPEIKMLVGIVELMSEVFTAC